MQPSDDRMPDELDPQNKEVIAFLRLVPGTSARAERELEREKPALGRVRQRLLEVQMTQGEDPRSKSMLSLIEVPEGISLRSKQHMLPTQKQGWSRRFALLVATLVMALIVGSLLMMFNLAKHTSFIAASTNQQSVYALSGGWLQKFDTQSGSLLWKAQIQTTQHQAGLETFTPASNGVVYITSGQKISTIKANNGSPLWSKDINGEVVKQMVYENNMLFVLTQQDSTKYNNHTSLKAFDALSGRDLWHYDQAGLFSSFAVVNHVVYGGINLNIPPKGKNKVYAQFDLFALKAINGSLLWRIHMNDPFLVSTSGEITVANNRVYVEANTLEETKTNAHGYSHLYAYNASNGVFLWSTLDSLSPILGSLLPGQQMIFATSGSLLYALQEQNGQLLWRYTNKNGGALNCSLTSHASDVFCLKTEGSSTYLVQLGANDGQEVAKHLVEHFGNKAIRAPLPSATVGNDPQGTAPSSVDTGTLLLFPVPLTGEDVSYVVTPDGNFDAFDNQTGKQIWSKHLIGMPGQVNLMLGA
ncbi:PQQ-like beta-propeller repeat protein [Ktedonobacter racemifer]|uniref:WD40-like repeat protein n=1 Tax=Ktedonobacter racemifer DSM 44963 TaxID=485913 RepID=D6TFX7_KTERA|nr:PQQ-binding-like beta-propeller repeat protein [Ktedonobacter racemifer]EFH90610.1 WD40-like repeat protein [Ktedonobacter racemifer DSM 44963]